MFFFRYPFCRYLLYCLLSLLLLFCRLFTDAMPYQFLPTREGYVPVYIRLGDTPLNEINPDLAVAFHEGNANGRQLKSDDGVSDICLPLRRMNETTNISNAEEPFFALFCSIKQFINGPAEHSEPIAVEHLKHVSEPKAVEAIQAPQPVHHKL